MTTKYLPTADGTVHVPPSDATPVTTTLAANTDTSTPNTSATNPAATTTAKEQTTITAPPAIDKGKPAAKQKDVSAPGSTSGQKKKRTSVFRRRLRRRGQREEATLTRLAAVLGQIKEACMEEEVGSKIAPLIESATRMIEALSENQKQQTVNGGTAIGRGGKADGSPSDGADEPTSATSPMKSNQDRGRRTGFASDRYAGAVSAAPGVVPGSKIPPHIYRPRMWNSPYINMHPLMTAESKGAIQMDQMKLEMRSRLRNAKTADEFSAIAVEAERLGMTHESTAARNHIAKLSGRSEI